MLTTPVVAAVDSLSKSVHSVLFGVSSAFSKGFSPGSRGCGDLLLLDASGSLGSVLSSETSEVVVSAMVEKRPNSLAVEGILRELSVDLVLV